MTNPYTSPPLSERPRRRWLPDWLATRRGRLTAFFLLYLTEGIPLGFTATAVATQMRRQGLTPTEIGIFVGTLYLPWAWKWLVAPVVDVVHSDRLGRRRVWIVAMQALMMLALFASMGIDYTADLQLYTGIILLVNIFGATQDVAIDALACEMLDASERGTANGLMFAGAYLGNALGGSGVLFLSDAIGFSNAALLAIGSIAAVTLLVALPLREKRRGRIASEIDAAVTASRLRVIGTELKTYTVQTYRAFTGSRGSLVAVLLALLPFGALSLSLALGSNLAVELDLTDKQIATLALVVTVVSAAGCVVGGYLSDRLGRRATMAIYVIGMGIPPLVMASYMQTEEYIWPLDMTMENRPAVPGVLVTVFWVVSIAYGWFQGLMHGTRTALFMDVCSKTVAATQFTAYMSLLNLTIWYSATWQGWSIEKLGYPMTLRLDVGIGLLCLAVLPWVTARRDHAEPGQLPAEPTPGPNV
jgi:MFS family permease